MFKAPYIPPKTGRSLAERLPFIKGIKGRRSASERPVFGVYMVIIKKIWNIIYFYKLLNY